MVHVWILDLNGKKQSPCGRNDFSHSADNCTHVFTLRMRQEEAVGVYLRVGVTEKEEIGRLCHRGENYCYYRIIDEKEVYFVS